MPKKNTGKNVKRSLETEGFYSDFIKEDTLYAALVRSPASTGKIKSIVLQDIPEGYFMFTAKDIPGKKELEINKTKEKIFGYNTVNYSGEPIAIIAGPDEKLVNELLSKVVVNFDIESLEAALNNAMKQQKRVTVNLSELEAQNVNNKKTKTHLPLEKEESGDLSAFVSEINRLPSLDTVLDTTHIASNEEATLATREIKTGLFKELSLEEAGKELFKEDNNTFISSEIWEEELTDPSWQETNGAFVYLEKDNLHIYAPTKWTSFSMKALSESLKLPLEKIFIHKTKGTGVYDRGLWRTSQIMVQVALASLLTGKPVKLVLSQEEQDTFLKPGISTKIRYKTSMSKNGKITALDANIDIDVGSWNPFAQEIVDRFSIAACNYYRLSNVHIYTHAHTSKNPPTSICLKSIDSQVFFAIENQIQQLSNQSHLFPDEIRLINKKKSNDYPIVIPNDAIYQTISQAIKISDFNRKYASFNMDAINRIQKNSNPFFALPLRGIGIATAYNASDFYGSTLFYSRPKIEVTMTSKDKVIIHALKPSEIIENIWKETASEILQIEKENIEIDSVYNLEDIPDYPEDMFSTLGTINELIRRACLDIQKKRFHQPLPISSKKTLTASSQKNWNRDTFSGTPFSTPAFATCIVEVELDTYTYNEKIKGIWLVADCGEVFDEEAANKSLKLEIQQELSMLVEGKTIPCENTTVKFIKSKNKSGQMSSLVHNTLPAAFSCALSLALATQLTKLPCTENQLFELIKDRETVSSNENIQESQQKLEETKESTVKESVEEEEKK